MRNVVVLSAAALALIAASALSAAPLVAAAPIAAPQAAPAGQTAGPYWAIVTGDGVMLRSGPSVSSAYPFGRLSSGQPLRVLEAQYGWARVQAVGPSFDTIYGFIEEDGSVAFDPATKSLTIAGRTPLRAPNMDANFAPDKSWRQLLMLAEGEKLEVMNEVRGERSRFFAVRLPARAEGWVNLQFLNPASQADADRFEEALRTGAAFPTRVAAAAPNQPAPQAPARTPTETPAQPAARSAAPPAPPPPVVEDPARVATERAPESAEVEAETIEVTETTERVVIEEVPAAAPPAAAAAEVPLDPMGEAAARLEREAMEAKLRQVSYQDLEFIWSKVRNEPTETAELDTLRERYLALAADGTTPIPTRELARARGEQILMRIEVQRTLRELDDRKAARNQTRQSIADLEMAMLQRRPFDAVGRLMASTVYDGDRLPLLYKIVDPTSGYTISYVMPTPTTKPSEALGLVVGIKGRRQYDETLRINVIAPEAIEALDTRTTAVVVPQSGEQ